MEILCSEKVPDVFQVREELWLIFSKQGKNHKNNIEYSLNHNRIRYKIYVLRWITKL